MPSAAATLTGSGSGVPSAFAAVSAFSDAAGLGAPFCWLPDLWWKKALDQFSSPSGWVSLAARVGGRWWGNWFLPLWPMDATRCLMAGVWTGNMDVDSLPVVSVLILQLHLKVILHTHMYTHQPFSIHRPRTEGSQYMMKMPPISTV